MRTQSAVETAEVTSERLDGEEDLRRREARHEVRQRRIEGEPADDGGYKDDQGSRYRKKRCGKDG